jgi:hypothetical protein
MSGGHGRQLDEGIVAQRCHGFQGHVAGALHGPHQPGWPAEIALREGLLRAGPGREPDQGAQAAPCLRPHLMHQGHRQPISPVDPHHSLLAVAYLARPGAPGIVLARRPVRYHPPLPDQGGRACQLAIAGALSRHRLLGADRLRAPRGSDPRLRPRGGDLLRR